jgi:flavin reductase (DIM6/NTAB) family NADH-FMN oxidoreductase RutF
MEIDFTELKASRRYKVLSSLVIPRPIAWVTTLDTEGRVNAAPFSFFNVFGADPPLVAFAPGNKEPGLPKDTARNIRENREFVIHLVSPDLADEMVLSSATLPHGESELQRVGLTTEPSQTVKPPRIARAQVALECLEHQTIEIGNNRLVLGIVQHVFAKDGLLDPENFHLNQEDWTPVGRMASPAWYCQTADIFEKPRPD